MSETKTQSATIDDLAREFDRLFPDQVDSTEVSWGHGTEAGHIGHEGRDGGPDTVGWYCEGGNQGNPVLRLATEDVADAVEALRAMPSPSTLDAVRVALFGLETEWLV